MNAPLFLKNKISRLLKSEGIEYEFTTMGVDGYNQPIELETIKVLGVYHEQNSFISVSGSDSASIQRKKSPMILTLFDDSVRVLKQGDKIRIDSTLYRISGILDIQNYGVAADISLEMEV